MLLLQILQSQPQLSHLARQLLQVEWHSAEGIFGPAHRTQDSIPLTTFQGAIT